MTTPLPIYTASRLYVVSVPPLERVFVPAGHEPRYVVGIRTYSRDELTRSPEDPTLSPFRTGFGKSFVTLIDDATRDVVIANVPVNRCCQFFIDNQSKTNGNTGANCGFGPIVFPFEAPALIDLGGSWIYNPDPLDPDVVAVEFFWNDQWRP